MLKKLTKAQWLCLLAAAVLCCVTAFALRGRDVFDSTLSSASYISDYDPEAADVSGYAGAQIADDEWIDLRPGSCTVEISYAAEGDGGYVQLVDAENVRVLAEGSYGSGGSTLTLQFTLAERLPRLAVRSYCGSGRLVITGYHVYSAQAAYTDSFWFALLLFCLLAGLLYAAAQWRMGEKNGAAVYLLALLVSVPLLGFTLKDGQDLPYHLTRLWSLASGLLHGQFPVRLSETFLSGAGYLSSVMYPELFLYPAAGLCIGGASVLFAYKALLLGVNLLTALAGYHAAKLLFKDARTAALFAAAYLLNPYRLSDLYLRAALGEALAMAFLPLAAAGICLLTAGDYKKGILPAVLGITGVFQSHILSMLLLLLFAVPAAGLYAVTHFKKFFGDWRRLLTICVGGGLTLGLNLWFLVPFAAYSRWDFALYHDTHTLAGEAVSLWQVFADFYTYEGSKTGTQTAGEMSFSIGLAALLAAVLFILLYHTLTERARLAGGICLGLGALAVWMSTNQFPWQLLERLSLVRSVFTRFQFPWRFLTAAALLFSVVIALTLSALQDKSDVYLCRAGSLVLSAVLVYGCAVVLAGYLRVNPVLMQSKSDVFDRPITYDLQYIQNAHTYSTVNSRARAGGVFSYSEGVTVSDYEKQGANLSFSFTIADCGKEDTAFSLPIYGYDMHHAVLNETGQQLEMFVETDGRVYVLVPAGIASGSISVTLYTRRIFRIADLLSLGTAVVMIGGCAVARRRKRAPKAA